MEASNQDNNDHQTSRLSERGRRRLTRVILLGIVVLLLMLSLIAQGGFKPVFSPDTTGETLMLYALSSLNFLAFVTLLFILLRNVLKLVRERRAGRLGSKFKARLVSYGIGLSLLPALLLFFFAFGLLNRSIDRWFGDPARQIADDSRALEESYFKKEESDLENDARDLAQVAAPVWPASRGGAAMLSTVRQGMVDEDILAVRLVSAADRITVTRDDIELPAEVQASLAAGEQAILAGQDRFTARQVEEGRKRISLVVALRIGDSSSPVRAIVLARELPQELTEPLASIHQQHEKFHDYLANLRRIKAIYILLLAAVALLLIFAASWLALHLARGITVPIQALAEATDRIARGDFSRPVDVSAEDELASLVNSFNLMASQLCENRERLELAAEDLRRTNLALDDRRRYIETVLESLSTGVISTDQNSRVTTINRAAVAMLGLPDTPTAGTPVAEVIKGPQSSEITTLCRRARRTHMAQSEIEFRRADGSSLNAATAAIALQSSEGVLEGWVIVIEDLTDLIQAERAAAWSEVARRMAHEIKNPLTPIQLSAERIMRHYSRAAGDPRFDDVVREGTSTIVREVSALQRMVEEFSRFARLPESHPVEGCLNETVRDAMALYADRLDGITLECDLANDVPDFRFDPEQIKRVMINLVDNAIEALTSTGPGGNGSGNGQDLKKRTIRVESHYIHEDEIVRLSVADNGHGIRTGDRDKLFLPKFSTRNRGTGLGLAIVSHIIADHKGRIWAEDNHPRGARMVIELPVA
ncbi:MAG TPA: ATP-binding protein [Blastocatellia bacterium]|nr:ATP-binding protein [Blastocatellia bacterium]